MPVTRLTLCLASLLIAAGCTFGVDAVEIRKEAAHDAAGLTLFRDDLSFADELVVTGHDESVVRAALVARGLLAPGDLSTARESFEFGLEADGDVLGVTVGRGGPYTELLLPARLELELPATMDLELELGPTSARVVDIAGLARIDGSSGSVMVERGGDLDIDLDSGSITAQARSAVLCTDSGSIDAVVDEHLEARASSGSIDAQARSALLRTDSGSIDAVVDEHLEATATSGSIDAQARSALLRTDSGSMHLVIGEHIDAAAGSGSITVELANGSGEIHTQDGSIEITLTGPLREDLNVSAEDGSVRVRILPGIDANLDLAADEGSVRVNDGVRNVRGDSFTGSIGNGGATLRIRTADGDIVVDASDEGR